jgi:hypothetical protein
MPRRTQRSPHPNPRYQALEGEDVSVMEQY